MTMLFLWLIFPFSAFLFLSAALRACRPHQLLRLPLLCMTQGVHFVLFIQDVQQQPIMVQACTFVGWPECSAVVCSVIVIAVVSAVNDVLCCKPCSGGTQYVW